jgi:hypothetical protein
VESKCDETRVSSTEPSTVIKKREGSGLTKELGKPLAESNELSQMHADVSSKYTEMNETRKKMGQSGISQVFGDLLPGSSPQTEVITEEKLETCGASNETVDPYECKAEDNTLGKIDATDIPDGKVLAQKNEDIITKYKQMKRPNMAQSAIFQAFGDLLPKKASESEDEDASRKKSDE